MAATVKAYQVTYRVRIKAYGKNAEEAAEHGYTIFSRGDCECEVAADDYKDDPESFAAMIAFWQGAEPIGRPKRMPEYDETFDVVNEYPGRRP